MGGLGRVSASVPPLSNTQTHKSNTHAFNTHSYKHNAIQPQQDVVRALPIPDAIETLSAAWSLAYRALGSTSSSAIPTADLLSGAASTFGASLDSWRAAKVAAAAAELKKASSAGSRLFGRKKKDKTAADADADAGSEGSVASMASKRSSVSILRRMEQKYKS
jgi:hypothetical protein